MRGLYEQNSQLLWVPGLVLIAVAALLVRRGEIEFAAARDRGWQTVPAASAPSTETHATMVADGRGQVWFLTTSGDLLVYGADGRLVKTMATDYAGATFLAVDPSGWPWIGSAADEAVYVPRDAGHWNTYLAGSPVDGLVVDRQGIGWVMTDHGLYRIDPRLAEQHLLPAGPALASSAHDRPRAMAVDGTGRLAAIYDDGSLYETADGANWTQTPTGLAAVETKDCLAFDAQNQPWVCSGGRVLHLGADGQWRTVETPSALAPHGYAFNSWAMDGAGNVWLGTAGAGLYEYDHTGAWHAFTPENSALDTPQVQVALVDRRGTVWADTGNNVFDLTASQAGALPVDDPRPRWRATATAALLAGVLLAVAAVPGALQPGNLALFAVAFVGWLLGDAILGAWLYATVGGAVGSGQGAVWLLCGLPLVVVIHLAALIGLPRRSRWLALGLASAVGFYVLGTLLVAPAGQATVYAFTLYPFYLPLPR